MTNADLSRASDVLCRQESSHQVPAEQKAVGCKSLGCLSEHIKCAQKMLTNLEMGPEVGHYRYKKPKVHSKAFKAGK